MEEGEEEWGYLEEEEEEEEEEEWGYSGLFSGTRAHLHSIHTFPFFNRPPYYVFCCCFAVPAAHTGSPVLPVEILRGRMHRTHGPLSCT